MEECFVGSAGEGLRKCMVSEWSSKEDSRGISTLAVVSAQGMWGDVLLNLTHVFLYPSGACIQLGRSSA